MATLKLVLRKKMLANGDSPLAIRITHERKSSYIHLGQSINESDWDDLNQRVRKSHPNSKWLNAFISNKLANAKDNSLELETTKPNVTAKTVSRKIKPKAGSTIFPISDLYISQLKEDGKYNRWNSEKTYVKHLQEYLKNDIAFQDLTVSVLERFKANMITTYKMSERSAINHLVTVRSIFSFAIKEGVCDAKYYPFGKGGLKIKFPDSQKLGLNAKEVEQIEQAALTGKANHARNIWLLSFYFAGIRVSDVFRLEWSDLQDGRLYYKMGKNNKGESLKVSQKVEAILNQYMNDRQEGCDLIFPELRGIDLTDKFETQKTIASRINTIDKLLRKEVAQTAKIKKPLTMHISRHTFGNLSGDKIPVQMLQKLYRHSSITTTISYQANFINKDADDALDAVIGS